MKLYTLFLKTSKEALFLEKVQRIEEFSTSRFYWPRRTMPENKLGKIRKRILPIFPAYIFWETEEYTEQQLHLLRQTPGFLRILNSFTNISPLNAQDHRFILKLVKAGDITGISKVTFDENQRIHVVEGPLKDLEGKIVRVDRRKRRAKVSLSLYNESFLIDFCFEHLKKADNQQEKNS